MCNATEPTEPICALKKAESGESDTAPVRTSGSGLVRTGDAKPRSQPSPEDTARKLKALKNAVELLGAAPLGEGVGAGPMLPALALLPETNGDADAVGVADNDAPSD